MTNRALKIVVVDDHEIVRSGVRARLETHPGWQVVGEAGDGREGLAVIRKLKPDVVIMDIGMPELNGLEATRQLLEGDPTARVLILTLHESEQLIREILTIGARGYLLKSDAVLHLFGAVESISDGGTYFTRKVSELVLSGYLNRNLKAQETPVSRERLSPRENQIVQLLAEGKSNKEVASALNISVKTVETHRANIMDKLQTRSFSDLVRYAIRENIIEA